MPFIGEFAGSSWNSQALFARRSYRHHPKLRQAWKLAAMHDFTGLQETHSTKGRIEALRLPPGTNAFWSHGTTHQAGIGLVVKTSFMDNFNPVAPEDWNEIVEGRVAALRLRGPDGSLDIFVVYLQSGEEGSVERAAAIRKLAASIQERKSVLSVVLGDFNYVPSKRDRISKSTGEFTGHRDERDEEEFQRLIAVPYQMHELEQEHFTHDNAQVRSRIDRIHSNHHVVDQLDRWYSCAALAWVKGLSAHRPVSFSRRKKGSHEDVALPVPTAPMDDPEWATRVALKYGELRQSDPARDQPLRRLVLVKQAIREVSLSMGKERKHNIAKTMEDKLGWSMTFLRAAEDTRLNVMEKCALAYPHLSTLADYRNPNLRAGGSLDAVRDHVMQLARSSITSDLKALENSSMDECQRANHKEHLLVRLKRLLPGA
jgi:exonuclease III